MPCARPSKSSTERRASSGSRGAPIVTSNETLAARDPPHVDSMSPPPAARPDDASPRSRRRWAATLSSRKFTAALRDERDSGGRTSFDQPKLGCTGEPLDPSLLAQRGGPIGDREHNRELNRAAAARVAAAGARTVRYQALLDVGRPAAVEAVIGAAEEVNVCHA